MLKFLKLLFGPDDGPPKVAAPPPTGKIRYAFKEESENGPALFVEIPCVFQKLKQHQEGTKNEFFSADPDHRFTYLEVPLATGAIYSSIDHDRRDLGLRSMAKSAKIEGWSFMLGAIELINANQFLNYHLPANYYGFDALWDIASMMENGERVLFVRSAYPHDLMLTFSNQLRMLLAPIQSAQRSKRAEHIRLFKLISANDTGPEFEALRAELAAHYAETFTPPELLF